MIKYFKPFIPQTHENYFSVIDSGWLTSGKYTEQLENEWAKLCGCKYAVAVSSASAGLHIALLAHDIQSKTVVTTDYTYIATFLAGYYSNYVKLVDVDDQYNISIPAVKEQLDNYYTDAVMPVHIGGKRVDLSQIKKYKKVIIEDCAHRWPGPHVGDCQVYSLYANKLITSGEGGIITTNDKNVYKKLKELRYQGRSAVNNHDYDIMSIGYKYNMPDVLSAIALTQLPFVEWNKKERHRVAKKYIENFNELKLGMQTYDIDHAYHLFLLRFDTPGMREFVIRKISPFIETSRHYKPLSTMTILKRAEKVKPKALELYDRTASLPIYPTLTDDEIDEVINRISKAVEDWRWIHGAEIKD